MSDAETLSFKTGLIFDFNGTLMDDGSLHEDIWYALIGERWPERYSFSEVKQMIRGRSNQDIVSTLLNRKATSAETRELAGEKERRYRQAFHQAGIGLAPGVAAFLDQQQAAGRALALATLAPPENVELYRQVLGIGRWFVPERLLYDDGTFPGKPAPDIFLKAAAALGLAPSECTVFGDAPADVTAAQLAGIGQILQVDLKGDAPLLPGAHDCLRGFAAASADQSKS